MVATLTAGGETAYADLPPGTFYSPTPSGQEEGFAGHDNLSDTGLVDMEGRVYDPEVGSFLSADPNVQYPFSSQGYDRYTYVNDNPLSLSDPSGYFSVDQVVGIAAAIVIEIYTPGNPYAVSFLSGSVGGYISSGGNLQTGIESGLEAMAFTYAGGQFGQSPEGGELLERSAVEGLIGGAFSEAGGGRFGDGFIGAFAGSEASGAIDTVYSGNNYYSAANVSTRVALSAIVGGTVSRLTGGDFADGAVAAAFQRLYNDESNHLEGKTIVLVHGYTVTYIYPNGDIEVVSNGNPAWRYNDPGDLKYGPFARKHGAIGDAYGFAIFPDARTGWAAAYARMTSGIYINSTLDAAIDKWAPPCCNDTAAYQAAVREAAGVSGNTLVKNLTVDQLNSVIYEIGVREGFFNIMGVHGIGTVKIYANGSWL